MDAENRSYAIPTVILLDLVLFLFFSRASLLFLFVPLTVVLTMVRFVRPSASVKAALVAFVILFLIVAVPVDISFRNSGHFGARTVPIIWGLPTTDMQKRINNREFAGGGCMVPIWPATTTLEISY